MKAITGTAGWNIPKICAQRFPGEGSHLERYSAELPGVEINSSFYRDHLPKTYARWRAEVPAGFLFAVKLFQRFTHEQRLAVDSGQLAETAAGILELKEKLGALLVQLPPSLGYEPAVAERFWQELRKHFQGPVAFEPRHRSWLVPRARDQLLSFGISKVRADPEPCPVARPEDWEARGFRYFRLHGSPEMYRSNYEDSYLQKVARALVPGSWCIFDNTTFGHAWNNALDLRERVASIPETKAS